MDLQEIPEYGMIGNSFSSALISLVGSIDWCCFPYLDSPSHFGAFTRDTRGGHFQISPHGEFISEQHYIPNSLVLQTHFETPRGRGILTDWMPTTGTEGLGPVIDRKLEVVDGEITWILHCTPRFSNGKTKASAEIHSDGILFRGTLIDELALLQGAIPLDLSGDHSSVRARFKLSAGEVLYFEWRWGRWALFLKRKLGNIHPEETLRQTLNYWQSLSHSCSTSCIFSGPWHDLASRSALMTRLFTTPYSGSISEGITGNLRSYLPTADSWIHSYSSIRDCAIRFQVLLGLSEDCSAQAYFQWLRQIIERDAPDQLQPFYSLDGSRLFPEDQNGGTQFHLDLFGHLFLVSTLYYLHFKTLPDSLWNKLSEMAEFVCESWKRPDHGCWGSSSKPKHFLISKLFCWVTLHHAHWLADALGKKSPLIWRQQANVLHKTIFEQGFDEKRKTFVRAFGETEVDTSCLWLPFLNFLPIGDSKIQGTLHFIREELTDGTLLKRCTPLDPENRWGNSPDFWSSFMWASCLALSGQVEEASRCLAELQRQALPLGLLGDFAQIRPLNTIEIPQQFPSASSHFHFLNAAFYVGWAKSNGPLAFPLMGVTPFI